MRIFYILTSIILFSVSEARSQSHSILASDPEVKIVKFYPNPAISFITFDFQKPIDKGSSFQIFSFIGKKVYDNNSIDQKTVVNLSDFYRGIYIFQLRDQTGKILESGKFQVAK
jgi:hypothetical protein